MTAKGELYRRVQMAQDRLAWGCADLRRLLSERGWWPSRPRGLVSVDGSHWAVTETRLRAVKPGKAEGLLVPESESLWGSAVLPDMPRHALRQAVEETLWRTSPLPRQHTVAAWHAQPHAQGGWVVEWGLCRRSHCDTWCVEKGLGPQAPVYLARHGRAFAVDSGTTQTFSLRRRWMHVLVLMGALLSLAALFLPALMPLVLKREDVLRAVQHIAAVEPQSQPLRQQLDELRQQAALGEELRQGLQQSLPLASVVDALSQALPDDTWLDRIDVNGNEIRISGLTGNAAELAALLGRQPQFADTKATVASVRDNNLNKERFTFEMRWRAVEGVKP